MSWSTKRSNFRRTESQRFSERYHIHFYSKIAEILSHVWYIYQEIFWLIFGMSSISVAFRGALASNDCFLPIFIAFWTEVSRITFEMLTFAFRFFQWVHFLRKLGYMNWLKYEVNIQQAKHSMPLPTFAQVSSKRWFDLVLQIRKQLVYHRFLHNFSPIS